MTRDVVRRIATGLAVVLVLALLVVGGRALLKGPKQNTATAYFPVAVHVYAGSDVDVLGVKIGKVTTVTPQGTKVKVEISYDASRKIPANASAVVLDPTLVADRVVQLAPVYTDGPVMSDKAVIPIERNEVPVELDELNQNLVELTDALGPAGANKNGALSRAIEVGAANLRGQGKHAHTTMHRLAQLVSTLNDNRGSLVDTVNNLQSFTSTLAAHDAETRSFSGELTRVSGQLADERAAFSSALHNLQLALSEVAGFIRDNRKELSTDVSGLATVSNILVKEKTLLAHMVDLGAVGVGNYPHMYTPSQRTYNARFDGNSISDNPAVFLCQLLHSVGATNAKSCKDEITPIIKHLPSAPQAKK